MSEEENEALIDFERELEDGRLLKSDILLSLDTGVILLDLIKKQQKEIKDWFEIADNILRATNDYGNITIGDIPKYIENQQKEIKKEKSRIMELDELLDKQENEIKFLKGELEIQEGCSISKDKIREIRDKAEVMDYYSLNDVIDDLSKLIGDYEEDD